jgi:hypothetical protein
MVHVRGLVNLSSLNLEGDRITGAGMRQLAGLTRLTNLELSATRVETLDGIKNLKNLRRLMLLDAPLDDSGFAAVAGFTALTELRVGGSGHTSNARITDAGLVHLRGLTGLKKLYVGTNGITGPGLENLRGLTNLEDLNLSDNPLSGGLEHLAGLSNLEILDLSCTWISGTGLGFLTSLPKLEFLDVQNSSVNDLSLMTIGPDSKLQVILLDGTNVTGAGLEWLARHAPASMRPVLVTGVDEDQFEWATLLRPGLFQLNVPDEVSREESRHGYPPQW